MSRSWNKQELQAASAAMKAAGFMGYEEFCKELEKQSAPSDGFEADDIIIAIPLDISEIVWHI